VRQRQRFPILSFAPLELAPDAFLTSNHCVTDLPLDSRSRRPRAVLCRPRASVGSSRRRNQERVSTLNEASFTSASVRPCFGLHETRVAHRRLRARCSLSRDGP